MRSDGELLRLNDATLKALRQDTELQKSLNQRWIDRLSKLDAHVDTAAFLSVHYLAAERFEDAARVAVNIAESANLGWWNKIYVILLEGLARRRSFKRLSPETQVRLLNALGMCLSHVGKHRDALKRFDQLRRLATRHRNAWGVGQSFINAGVAAHQGGDDTSAEQFYEKAVEHGKRSRDPMLRGRALSNLSQLYQNTDVDRAEAMLEESLKAKAAANDSFGFVAGIAVRAGFAVAREQFAVAAKLYQQAAQAAARLGLRYEQAMSTYNQGRALQDLGRMRSAMRLFERARLLAVPDDHTDVLQLALNALAAGAFAAKRYRDVLRFGQELLAVTKRTQNQEYELGSLHMMAVASLGLQRTSEAQHGFRAAIKTARAANRDEWVVRSIVDSIRPATKSAIGNPDRSQLKRIAKTEAANGHRVISSGLWTWVAKLSASAGAKEDASEAYETADTCLPKGSESASERFELYRNRFAWAWQSHRFEEAVRVLDKMERFATQSGIMDEALAAMDQRGVCLQELGRHAEAEPLHRTAARVAKRLGQDQQEENSLNNLGEALRHLIEDRPFGKVVLAG
jgi:tetratricopeptide (TPR) repeat protein